MQSYLAITFKSCSIVLQLNEDDFESSIGSSFQHDELNLEYIDMSIFDEDFATDVLSTLEVSTRGWPKQDIAFLEKQINDWRSAW